MTNYLSACVHCKLLQRNQTHSIWWLFRETKRYKSKTAQAKTKLSIGFRLKLRKKNVLILKNTFKMFYLNLNCHYVRFNSLLFISMQIYFFILIKNLDRSCACNTKKKAVDIFQYAQRIHVIKLRQKAEKAKLHPAADFFKNQLVFTDSKTILWNYYYLKKKGSRNNQSRQLLT